MADMPHSSLIDKPARRRAPWRQRLVEAERGITQGIRGDGTLFFYLFVDSAVLAVGCVLHLSFIQWLLVALAVTMVLSLELMHQALRLLVDTLRVTNPHKAWDHVMHISTAAVVLAFIGGSTVVGSVYWQRIREMFDR